MHFANVPCTPEVEKKIKMKISHISDCHGYLAPLSDNCDVVVSSGDFLPNCIGSKTDNIYFQIEWLKTNAENIKSWINNKPFLFCAGNHDMIQSSDMERILKSSGINAYDLNNKIVNFNNYNFYGFPYIPIINGNWNYELEDKEMLSEVKQLLKTLNSTYIDIVVAHCPPYGILDLCPFKNVRYGITHMANMFNYSLSEDMFPLAYLTGHIHQKTALTSIKNGILFSNAASNNENVIELD